MTAVNNISNFIDAEGRELQVKTVRLSSTAMKVTWVPSPDPKAYNGVLVVASPLELNASNFPTDGVRYTASPNLAAPADKLGAAQVVGVFYDDVYTDSLTITGLEADAPYYVAVHLATTVYGYFNEGCRAYAENDDTTVFAGRIPEQYSPPENPAVGQVYYDPVQRYVFVWDGATWQTSTAHTAITGEVDPVAPFTGMPDGYPVVGSFFYNTRTQQLKSWTGTVWRVSEPDKGQPTYSKQGIGTTGEFTARYKIKNILKHQLGYPRICVELTEEHFNIAIDNALQELRRRTDSAYYKNYIFLQVMPNQQLYYLNDPTTGVDRIVDVLAIHRLNTMGLGNLNASNNPFAQQLINQFYGGNGASTFDMVGVHLVHALGDLYTQIFAGNINFNWRETTRELRLYRTLSTEKVLLECSMEKPEQELLVDRWAQQWIQQWAEAECMFMLSHIRGKFASLPGPGGGMSLNASEMMSEGTRLQDDCLRQVKDFEVGQNGPDNFYMPFIIG